jgi:hypothetical protein
MVTVQLPQARFGTGGACKHEYCSSQPYLQIGQGDTRQVNYLAQVCCENLLCKVEREIDVGWTEGYNSPDAVTGPRIVASEIVVGRPTDEAGAVLPLSIEAGLLPALVACSPAVWLRCQ